MYSEIPQGSQPLDQGDGRPCSPPSKAHSGSFRLTATHWMWPTCCGPLPAWRSPCVASGAKVMVTSHRSERLGDINYHINVSNAMS